MKMEGVNVAVTERVQSYAAGCLRDTPTPLSKEQRQALVDVANGTDRIQYGILRSIVKAHRTAAIQSGGKVLHPPAMHRLLEGSAIKREPLVEPEPSPELLALRKKLKAKLAHMEYNAMVKGVEKSSSDFYSGPLEVKEAGRQFSILAGLLVTLVACFFFGYYGSLYTFETLAARVLTGVIAALVGAGAELYFILRASYLTEEMRDRKKTNKKKDRPSSSKTASDQGAVNSGASKETLLPLDSPDVGSDAAAEMDAIIRKSLQVPSRPASTAAPTHQGSSPLVASSGAASSLTQRLGARQKGNSDNIASKSHQEAKKLK